MLTESKSLMLITCLGKEFRTFFKHLQLLFSLTQKSVITCTVPSMCQDTGLLLETLCVLLGAGQLGCKCCGQEVSKQMEINTGNTL